MRGETQFVASVSRVHCDERCAFTDPRLVDVVLRVDVDVGLVDLRGFGASSVPATEDQARPVGVVLKSPDLKSGADDRNGNVRTPVEFALTSSAASFAALGQARRAEMKIGVAPSRKAMQVGRDG